VVIKDHPFILGKRGARKGGGCGKKHRIEDQNEWGLRDRAMGFGKMGEGIGDTVVFY